MCLMTSQPALPTSDDMALTDQSTQLPQASGLERDTMIQVLGSLSGRRVPIWMPTSRSTDSHSDPVDTDESTEATLDVVPKKCFVCFEEILNADDAHRTLMPECGAHYYADDQYICTTCLRKHIYHKMFPLSKGDSNHNFPSMTVRCYQCYQALPHSIVQKYADPEAFEAYDQALFQRYLDQNETIQNCAFEDCDGAEWTDDPDCVKSKVFHCPACNRDTCLECHGPLQNHQNRSCPTGKDARNPMRIRLAETRSKFRIKTKNKCPKCPIRYEKMNGCDHIICGSWHSEGDFLGK